TAVWESLKWALQHLPNPIYLVPCLFQKGQRMAWCLLEMKLFQYSEHLSSLDDKAPLLLAPNADRADDPFIKVLTAEEATNLKVVNTQGGLFSQHLILAAFADYVDWQNAWSLSKVLYFE